MQLILVHLWNRMKSLGHCLMQEVNYAGSNEIKLMEAIKMNIKPFQSQIRSEMESVKMIYIQDV